MCWNFRHFGLWRMVHYQILKLLKALGITPAELAVSDEDLSTFRKLFDSPMRERHLQVIASLFGKMVPRNFDEGEACQVLVNAH
jgi:hypothetical protein